MLNFLRFEPTTCMLVAHQAASSGLLAGCRELRPVRLLHCCQADMLRTGCSTLPSV
jgi:hypothetical protein